MSSTENGKPTGGNGRALESKLVPLPDSDRRLLRKCVIDLVGLIQNPANLRDFVTSKAFEARLAKLGMSDSDAKKRVSLILSALPQTEALLSPVGDSTTNFRWQYDVHGFAVASKASVADAKDAVAMFARLQQHDAKLHEHFGVGIAMLEARFQMFQASIKWPEVAQLARQLDAATGIGEAAEASLDGTLKVKEYCASLSKALPRFAQAIAIGKLLAPNREAEKALSCVAEGLDLSLLPDEQRGERLLAALTEIVPSSVLQLSPGVDPNWPELAERLLPGSIGLSKTNWLEAYFQGFRTRLQRRISGSPDPGPGVADVAVMLSIEPKVPLLHRAWSKNLVGLWTELLLSAFTQRAASDGLVYPKWCVPYGLVQLGFIEAALSLATTFDGADVSSALGERRESGRRRMAVFVVADQSKLDASNWSLSPTCAAFVVNRSALATLAHHLGGTPIVFPVRDPWLFVEGTESEGPQPPESLLSAELPQLWQDFFSPVRRVQIFAHEPSKAGIITQVAQKLGSSPPRYFVGAKSIDDAVQKADALVTTSS